MENFNIVMTIIQIIIIPIIVFIYKNIDKRFSKIENKVDNISIKSLNDMCDKINNIVDMIITINNKMIELSVLKDDVKAIEAVVDRNHQFNSELLSLTIENHLNQFELKLIKDGSIRQKEKN